MPIDSSILLANAQPLPQVLMPNEARAQALSNRARALQVQEAEQGLKDRQVFQQAMQQSGGDLETALKAYATVSPEHALDVERIVTAKAQTAQRAAEGQQRITQGQETALRDRQKNFDQELYKAVNQAKPEERDAVFAQFLEQAKADGLRDLPQSMGPALLPRATRWGAMPEPPQPKPVGTHVVGEALVDDTGKVVYKGEEKAPVDKTPAVGSFEDYTLRTYGQNPTPAQILKARKEFNQSDDRPNVTVRMPNGMTPGQSFTAERQMRDEFNRETKSAQTVQQQLALMEASLQAVKSGKAPAGSQGVLVTFQKILDPTSVVRESEYARSGSGLALLSRLQGRWDTIQNGGANVPVGELEKFVELSREFAKRQQSFANQTKEQIDRAAKDYGLDPSRITKDIAAPLEPSTPTVSGLGPSYADYLKSKGGK